MYKITFSDYTTFEGGKDLKNSQWNEMPDKAIKKIEYTLNSRTIILENYETYNHLLVHGFALLTGVNNVFRVILLAKDKNIVKKFIFELINNNLIIEEAIYGKEYNNASTSGWKRGIENANATYELNTTE